MSANVSSLEHRSHEEDDKNSSSSSLSDDWGVVGNLTTPDDVILFDGVHEHYAAGKDIQAKFIINGYKTNASCNQDHIGIQRVGSSNMSDIPLAPVEYSSPSVGSATFPASMLLPSNKNIDGDEFFQFIYMEADSGAILGSSLPFQLNWSDNDLALLSSPSATFTRSSKNNHGMIALQDADTEDMLVVHTKAKLIEEKLRSENKQLCQAKKRLEEDNELMRAKFDLIIQKTQIYSEKVTADIQALHTKLRSTSDELASLRQAESKLRLDYEETQRMLQQAQQHSLSSVQQMHALEQAFGQVDNDNKQLQERLLDAKDHEHVANQNYQSMKTRMVQVQNQLSALQDAKMTVEKHLHTQQGQLEAYTKQCAQRDNQLSALENANGLLKEELQSLQAENHCLLALIDEEKAKGAELEKQIVDFQQGAHTQQNEVESLKKFINTCGEELEKAERENEQLRKEAAEMREKQCKILASLKTAYDEVEKRCVKHQKNELDVKRQLQACQEFLTDAQTEKNLLEARLEQGAEEYKKLYRKHKQLEHEHVLLMQRKPTTLSNETGLNEENFLALLRESYQNQHVSPPSSVVSVQQEVAPTTSKKPSPDDIDEQLDHTTALLDQLNQDQLSDEDEDQEEERASAPAPPTTTTMTTTRRQQQSSSSEIGECPMCYWEFPAHLTLDSKRDHIEHHFA